MSARLPRGDSVKRAALAALGMLLLAATGCAEVREGWDIGAAAAANLHRQDAQALCKSFDPEMLTALPCDAVEEVMARTTAVVGEPTGECRWGYTYRIVALEPLRSVVVYQCPFTGETVQVTIHAERRSLYLPCPCRARSHDLALRPRRPRSHRALAEAALPISGWIIESEVPELEHPKALTRLRTPRVLAPG